MPRTQPKKKHDRAETPKKSPPTAAAGAQAAAAPTPDGNGANIHNGNHERRRSGRVTYRPTATEMLTVHARTEDERLLAPSQRPAFLHSDPWRSLRILGLAEHTSE